MANSDRSRFKFSKFCSKKRKTKEQIEIWDETDGLSEPLLNETVAIKSLIKQKKVNAQFLRNLEQEHDFMQQSILALTSHLARIQFGLRQIIQSPSWERDKLLRELEAVAFESAFKNTHENMPTVYHDIHKITQIHKKRNKILNRLRAQLAKLYKKKYEQC